jgi:trk system potassium uptake protein
MSEYAVIGLGRFGRSLALEMQEQGNEVIGIDTDRQKVQDMVNTIRQSVQADATSEETLRELGVADLDAAVVAIRDPEASVMIALLLKKLGVPHVVARAGSDLHDEILRLVGADRVVFPEKESALKLAHSIAVPEVVDYLSISSDMGVSRLDIPRQLVGLTYKDADLERFNVRLIATIRRNRVLFGATGGDHFESGDALIVSGRDSDLRSLSQFVATKEG